MIIVLSPAKSLDGSPIRIPRSATTPVFQAESRELAEKLKKMSAARLRKLMDISTELAALNHARYQAWDGAPQVKPAVLMFNGEAYRGLGAGSLDGDDLRFTQRHLRILSGLYGLLRPMDLIAPHRLEMGTKLSMGRGKKDLYGFWGDRITTELNGALRKSGSEVLVNLASAEYFKSVRTEQLAARVITPVFKERTAGGLRMVTVYAKHQRGALCRYIIQRRLVDPEGIKQYDGDGYRYESEGSSNDEWLFVR
ncbi:MAG: peroxide stress protein YaaA [Flavobacteriales bacterium]|nr:peroxide stress protein YaaA [Flavobacteriales bacterium]